MGAPFTAALLWRTATLGSHSFWELFAYAFGVLFICNLADLLILKGKAGSDGTWSMDRIRVECRLVAPCIVRGVLDFKASDTKWKPFFDGPLERLMNDDFESRPEFAPYRQLLLGVAESLPVPRSQRGAGGGQEDPRANALSVTAGTEPIQLLRRILEKTTLVKWAEKHHLGRTTVYVWRNLLINGKPLTGKVSDEKNSAIILAIEEDAVASGFLVRIRPDR